MGAATIKTRAASIRAMWPEWNFEQHATCRTAGWQKPIVATAGVGLASDQGERDAAAGKLSRREPVAARKLARPVMI